MLRLPAREMTFLAYRNGSGIRMRKVSTSFLYSPLERLGDRTRLLFQESTISSIARIRGEIFTVQSSDMSL
jgi:hypothetical protein